MGLESIIMGMDRGGPLKESQQDLMMDWKMKLSKRKEGKKTHKVLLQPMDMGAYTGMGKIG